MKVQPKLYTFKEHNFHSVRIVSDVYLDIVVGHQRHTAGPHTDTHTFHRIKIIK